MNYKEVIIMGQIKVTPCDIEGLYIIEPTVHGDNRGYFMETYNQNDMHAVSYTHLKSEGVHISSTSLNAGIHSSGNVSSSQAQYPILYL